MSYTIWYKMILTVIGVVLFQPLSGSLRILQIIIHRLSLSLSKSTWFSYSLLCRNYYPHSTLFQTSWVFSRGTFFLNRDFVKVRLLDTSDSSFLYKRGEFREESHKVGTPSYTFSCSLLRRIWVGDRYWHPKGDVSGSFSSTLSRFKLETIRLIRYF